MRNLYHSPKTQSRKCAYFLGLGIISKVTHVKVHCLGWILVLVWIIMFLSASLAFPLILYSLIKWFSNCHVMLKVFYRVLIKTKRQFSGIFLLIIAVEWLFLTYTFFFSFTAFNRKFKRKKYVEVIILFYW